MSSIYAPQSLLISVIQNINSIVLTDFYGRQMIAHIAAVAARKPGKKATRQLFQQIKQTRQTAQKWKFLSAPSSAH
ncbi:hypothetical protein [Polaromonas sp.]|uniref:hypothetical protein n=1 Tax=Polaromonas sp. TaxID=1869339 RepID=UPI001D4E1705|nr:hypothetical protein [Polaromonas sp.]MBT9477299.1 hypothetical protein [Polaromonas sp.]